MAISEADALAAHRAIHGGKGSVKLADGSSLPVEKAKNGCRAVKFPAFQAMEQNKSKPSDWADQAKKGVEITWFVCSGGPKAWGRIVDGKVDNRGKAILAPGSSCTAAKAKASAKVPAAPKSPSSSSTAKAKASPVAASKGAAKALAKKRCAPETSSTPASKKTRAAPAGSDEAKPADESMASSSGSTKSSDPLALSSLFAGMGHGAVWEPILRPVLEGLSDAAAFIGPARDKRIVPIRELTFQALKPNPPSGWRVVSFGQSPYPRVESATGIAHFDNALRSWDDTKFGTVVTMRCLIKAAAMNKFGVTKSTTMPELRNLMKSKNIVNPAEWFQALLSQGVLLMNAACTLKPEEGVRAGEYVQEHLKFWQPVIEAVVNAILKECAENGHGVIFAWWGAESLKTKRVLDKSCFRAYPNVKVEHIEHKNPAAMGDAFCDAPNVFQRINEAITRLKLGDPIDWLPSAGWQAKLGTSAAISDEMGAFVAETQELHKMYLERLKDGLDSRVDDLPDITGIQSQPLVKLLDACKPLKLDKPAESSVKSAKSFHKEGLPVDEAAALHLYTTNFLYKQLNAALRDPNRKNIARYFLYLRLFMAALARLPSSKRVLYRGVALDLSEQYELGAEVTWWAVSSCTPDPKVAASFSGVAKRTLFIIDASRSVGIREFSQYKSEEEYILAPGTEFKVTDVKHKGPCIEIHMKELDRQRRVQ
eukprot:TRINITY_DN76070_c0_g1_i1.p1 TRINITY_DN76070_c0_g1~~TRINITY_DN76070_c0_g1_i1.p1  ORF type:complete len:708 (+),score=136.14 TRINITY_DN76070_c0_g1_i1:53-2176(+)